VLFLSCTVLVVLLVAGAVVTGHASTQVEHTPQHIPQHTPQRTQQHIPQHAPQHNTPQRTPGNG
jgi:predicted PurR-regulated permease PerM